MKIIQTLSQKHPSGELQLFKITNRSGANVTLCNIGAGVVSIEVPDISGKLTDVVLGYKHIEDYFGDGPCMGKTPGRFANRIGNARFTLNGVEYKLNANAGGVHHLHGGANGFANKCWQGRIDGDRVLFSLTSLDGDEGYPGTLTATVAYSWKENNELLIELAAESDADTIINLTNHTYFNLNGENSGSILDHILLLYATHWLPATEELITTGEIAPVNNTPMDFTEPKRIGQDINADFAPLKNGKGYDSCWITDSASIGRQTTIAVLHSPLSGITLEVGTTLKALQVYTGNWLSGSPESKSGRSYNDYDGVALECQQWPDAPNKPNFPSSVLFKGKRYEHSISFFFPSILKNNYITHPV
ncbi:MAG: galactose mutarotase [Prevotellaceae bacterium]|jgi:aldose 1-epimerase|nr:galactose mutarotase [Prevotellaceae bacterium]